jgi:hypothetical protein
VLLPTYNHPLSTIITSSMPRGAWLRNGGGNAPNPTSVSWLPCADRGVLTVTLQPKQHSHAGENVLIAGMTGTEATSCREVSMIAAQHGSAYLQLACP